MKFIEFIVREVCLLIVGAALDLYIAWLAMLWLGIAHGFDGRVPALGLWTCYFLIWALSAPVHSVRLAASMREAWEEGRG